VLQTLIGDYTLEGTVVNVSLAGGALRLTVPSQPVYELEPVHGLTFTLKGLNGYTAEFKKDASGKVTEMLFTQPEGSTVAKKN